MKRGQVYFLTIIRLLLFILTSNQSFMLLEQMMIEGNLLFNMNKIIVYRWLINPSVKESWFIVLTITLVINYLKKWRYLYKECIIIFFKLIAYEDIVRGRNWKVGKYWKNISCFIWNIKFEKN